MGGSDIYRYFSKEKTTTHKKNFLRYENSTYNIGSIRHEETFNTVCGFYFESEIALIPVNSSHF